MDLALARYSGQELHNDYVLTIRPAFGSLCKFFRAAIRDLILAYNDYPGSLVAPAAQPSICDQMRRDINANPQGSSTTSPMDPVVDIPVVESLSPLILSSSMPPPPVVTGQCNYQMLMVADTPTREFSFLLLLLPRYDNDTPRSGRG